jgi:molybdate transport repressor ModE-like protein
VDVETTRLSAASGTRAGSSASHATTSLQRVIAPRRLRLLLEVERLGSITRAAEACSVGQPTASADLRTLEAAVGHRLYERAGRATRLTDAGRLLAAHAAMVLSMLEGLEEELSALDGGLAGTLRVAACDGFGTYVVPAVLAQLARDRPRVEIQVRIAPSGEVVRQVAQGAAQLGIAGQTRRVAGVVGEPLVRDELVWIAPARVAGVQPVLGPVALKRLVLVVPGRESSTRALVERILGHAGVRPSRVLELDSVEAVKRAVRSGAGVAAVSRVAAADELAAGDLREVELLRSGAMERVIEVVRHELRKPTPLEQAFERSLREHCRRLGEAPQQTLASASR